MRPTERPSLPPARPSLHHRLRLGCPGAGRNAGWHTWARAYSGDRRRGPRRTCRKLRAAPGLLVLLLLPGHVLPLLPGGHDVPDVLLHGGPRHPGDLRGVLPHRGHQRPPQVRPGLLGEHDGFQHLVREVHSPALLVSQVLRQLFIRPGQTRQAPRARHALHAFFGPSTQPSVAELAARSLEPEAHPPLDHRLGLLRGLVEDGLGRSLAEELMGEGGCHGVSVLVQQHHPALRSAEPAWPLGHQCHTPAKLRHGVGDQYCPGLDFGGRCHYSAPASPIMPVHRGRIQFKRGGILSRLPEKFHRIQTILCPPHRRPPAPERSGEPMAARGPPNGVVHLAAEGLANQL
mmetsp:Transcript_71628/g.191075  ORF Transcript_71628/g.191075 Transcript_71628/m.191075 type:complete len:346 (-) Transcript_71628:136-1173(-)